MDMSDRLAAAHAAMAQGRYAVAQAALRGLLRGAPGSIGARHALAVCERRLGNLAAAQALFEGLVVDDPRNGELHNNFANLLDDAGDTARAAEHYGEALRLLPTLTDALINLGLAYRKLGRFEEAEAALADGVTRAPGNPTAWLGLGMVRMELGDAAGAETALDRSLALRPASAAALRARGQVESERGGDGAPYLARARAVLPDNPDLALDEVTARHGAGDPAAAGRLAAMVDAAPGWREAQSALAQVRWQAGDTEGFLAGYDRALAQPDAADLWSDYLRALMRAGRYAQALDRAPEARIATGAADPFLEIEAAAASELGLLDQADAAFAALASACGSAPRISHIRHLLRRGAYDAAAGEAEAMTRAVDANAAWSYLATAWRLTGDPRWDWLEGDPAFVATIPLDTIEGGLPGLAAALRTLHGSRRSPYDQTVSGGTQSEGHLFSRRDPAIAALRAACLQAVEAYVARLPPPDPRHPLLREPRDGVRFSGSWSVRLQGGGFHTNHVHPEGWISSVFYAALPAPAGTPPAQQGVLALGCPPAELGLPLEPYRLVEPRAGTLVLFPAYAWHGTRPFAAGERLTAAFDAVPARRR